MDGKIRVSQNRREDYLVAACCGILSGLVDVLYVGDAQTGILRAAIDEKIDWLIEMSSRVLKQDPNEKQEAGFAQLLNSVRTYIRNQNDPKRSSESLSDILEKDLVSMVENFIRKDRSGVQGLAASILLQFLERSDPDTVDAERIIRDLREKAEEKIPYLQGFDEYSKLFCGFANWVLQLAVVFGLEKVDDENAKDIRMDNPFAPIRNLLMLCDIEQLDQNTFTECLMQIYQMGADLRKGAVMAVPVFMEEGMVRTLWLLRRRFADRLSWEESLPSDESSDFRTLLLVGNGALCMADLAEAAVYGKANEDLFSMMSHLNVVGWARFAVLAFKEGSARLGVEIDYNGDQFLEKIFGELTDGEKRGILDYEKMLQEYSNELNALKELQQALDEYKEAREERIRIEKECAEKIQRIQDCRVKMNRYVEDYLSQYLIAFNEGFEIMDEAVINDDTDQFIEGNIVIQKVLDHDPQYRNKEEFDSLMESEDAFQL